MKTLRLIIRALSTVGLLLCISGCISYHVTPEHSLQGERGYKIIDTMLKRTRHGWKGSVEQIGATDQGWTDIEVVDTEYWSDGYNSATTYYGRAVTYKYADIEDVSVQAAFFPILYCGIIDPTTASYVQLKFKDGTYQNISAFYWPMRLFPLWIVNPEWRRAHNGAKAFQSIVTGLKTNGNQGQSGVNFKGGKPDGITKEYYESDNLKAEANFKDSKQDGIKKIYYESGPLKAEANFKAGFQDGLTKFYYESGKLQSEQIFKHGKLDGIAKMYYESGELKAKGIYNLGKGITEVYYESGSLQNSSHFEDGKLEGLSKMYYEGGQLKEESYWKDDKKISATCYDEKGGSISCPQ